MLWRAFATGHVQSSIAIVRECCKSAVMLILLCNEPVRECPYDTYLACSAGQQCTASIAMGVRCSGNIRADENAGSRDSADVCGPWTRNIGCIADQVDIHAKSTELLYVNQRARACFWCCALCMLCQADQQARRNPMLDDAQVCLTRAVRLDAAYAVMHTSEILQHYSVVVLTARTALPTVSPRTATGRTHASHPDINSIDQRCKRWHYGPAESRCCQQHGRKCL